MSLMLSTVEQMSVLIVEVASLMTLLGALGFEMSIWKPNVRIEEEGVEDNSSLLVEASSIFEVLNLGDGEIMKPDGSIGMMLESTPCIVMFKHVMSIGA